MPNQDQHAYDQGLRFVVTHGKTSTYTSTQDEADIEVRKYGGQIFKLSEADQARNRLDYAKDRDTALVGAACAPLRRALCGLLPEDLEACHHTRLGRFAGHTVWAVNGSFLRDNIDIDFVAGGNPARYAYVPKDEIWVERGLLHKDTCATLLHETYEMYLMYQGMSYSDAHDRAAEVERQFRKTVRKVAKDAIGSTARTWFAQATQGT